MFDLFATLSIAYLLGSIPFGLVFAKLFGAEDLRKLGSGNIGATNAMRVGGKKLGACTLIADALKGVLAVLIARIYIGVDEVEYLAGLVVVCGHICPIWLGFKGGKGVATTIAVLLTINPAVGFFMCCVWLIVFCISKIAAVASIFSIISANSLALIITDVYFNVTMCVLTILIGFRHRSNLKKLMINS